MFFDCVGAVVCSKTHHGAGSLRSYFTLSFKQKNDGHVLHELYGRTKRKLGTKIIKNDPSSLKTNI